jgi:hypothetical protein
MSDKPGTAASLSIDQADTTIALTIEEVQTCESFPALGFARLCDLSNR